MIMAICPNCKNEISNEAVFCPNCGTPIEQKAPYNAAPQPQQSYENPQTGYYQQMPPQNYAPVQPPQPDRKSGAKKGAIFGIIGAVLAIIIITVAVSVENAKSGNDITTLPDNSEIVSQESTTEKEKVNFVPGVRDETSYTSKFANLKFSLKDNWVIAADEDFADDDAVRDEATGLLVIDTVAEKTYYDVALSNEETGSSAQVIIFEEKTALSSSLSAKKYLETAADAYIDEEGANIGENTQVTIGTDTYERQDISYLYEGIEINQSLLCRKVDNYFVCICITIAPSVETTDLDGHIAMFENAQ